MPYDNVRSKKSLLQAIESGAPPPKFCFFWGHTPKHPGTIDKSCFSNWFPTKFRVDNNLYHTAEHYMMAEKARLFGDTEMEAKILTANTPAEAKKFGRLVQGFTDETWKSHRFEIVVRGNHAKFSQKEGLGDFLLKTGNRILVEAAPRDRIWGIGMGQNNPAATSPANWRGSNLLGFALMEVRSRLTNNQ